MKTYVILMRGINVGGKNSIKMGELRQHLLQFGFLDVITYIQSGNVLLRSDLGSSEISMKIEKMLPEKFKLHSPVRVLAIDHKSYRKIVGQAPKGFGKEQGKYRYNVIFLKDYTPGQAIKQIETREGVDEAWQGDKVLYFRNSMLNASKSRLSRIAQQPVYKYMTIRNWNTTTKLLKLLEEHSK